MPFRATRRDSSPDGLLPSVGHSSSRLEAFSDGVLAIAITLLILEVHVPDAEPGGLAAELAHQWPSYAAYAVTFLVIGIMWVNHHELFDGIAVVTRTLMFFNLFLLMAIAFLPFPTALMAQYLREGRNSHIATAVYGATMTLIGLGFVGLWWYLSRHPDQMVEGLDADDARQSMRRALPGPVIYGATIGLAYIWAPACLIVYAAMGIYFMLWRPSQVDEIEGADASGETRDQASSAEA
jgi:uncharacterized membrane protein